MFLINAPEPWQSYLNRSDNKGISLMEVKNKYMQEQLLFENYMSFQMQQQMLMSQQSSGGGPLPSTTSTPTVDPDAQAFITAAAITDTTQQSAINTLVVGLKTDSIWTKMRALYPIVGGTASQHKFNLKNPVDSDAAFRLTFFGGMTHSSNGILPSGTNNYANTYFVPSTQITDADSFHYSIYSKTDLGGSIASCDIGAHTILGTDPESYTDQYIHSFYYMDFFGNTEARSGAYVANAGFADNDSLGLYVGNRNSIGKVTAYKNGILKSTSATAASGLVYFAPMLLLNMSNYYPDVDPSSWSTDFAYGRRQLAFATIGDGLTNTDNSNLYTRIQAFQTTLGRQV
jgi:hypothetical protein